MPARMIEFCIWLLMVLIIVFQIIIPLAKDQKIFPLFRRKKVAVIQEKIKDANEDLEAAKLETVLKEKKESSRVIRNKNKNK